MNNTKLIFFDFSELYKIFNELGHSLNYELINAQDIKKLDEEINKSKDYLVITKDSRIKLDNQIFLKDLPLKITKILERINITNLKNNYSKKSNIQVGNYKININSKEIFFKDKSLKLTEKEIKMIIYISNSSNPVSINELQGNIWGYSQDLETHTVETHIHRLRKKVLNNFRDKDFIISTQNGYQIIQKK
tara:strand:- start:201 stop:773 length:573 start_codon:yes stop_codon:yes gene_type:complete